ncbi:MAG TPA: hypothetical protein PKN80_07060, partial [bacterium]|nr:hypothetical protein [bacterium]HNS49537.1 hypothetical protein [bacterium]
MKKETIKIGWAEADITPVKRIDLCGQYYPRLSRNIHSRLGLTVLALESESGEQAVLVSLDNVGISPGIMEMVRHRVKAAIPGIRPEKILVNATHVHTAPALYPVVGWYEPDREVITPEEYREFLCSRLVGAVARAWSGRAPGAVAAGRGYAVTGHCRRALFEGGVAEMYGDAGRDDFLGLEGNEDSTLELLFTYDGRKRPTGVILNAACPSQVMEATYSVSSDFMGEARRLLKKHFGAGFRTLCQVSAAGDQSPRDLVRNRTADFWGEKGVAVLGKRLSDAVIEAQAGIGRDEITGRLEFCHQVASLPLPMRFPAPAELAAARKELKRLT